MMKKYIIPFFCLLNSYSGHIICSEEPVAELPLTIKAGTYKMTGSSNFASGNISYQGEVIISPQGDTYSLFWVIGNYQAQIGTGILNGNVLSVVYYDVDKDLSGVVSYKILSEDHLEGKWCPIHSTGLGKETLIWKD